MHTIQRSVESVQNIHLQQCAHDFYHIGCLNRTEADNMARLYQVQLNHYQLAYHKAREQPVLNIFISFFVLKKLRCVKNVKTTLPLNSWSHNYIGKCIHLSLQVYKK